MASIPSNAFGGAPLAQSAGVSARPAAPRPKLLFPDHLLLGSAGVTALLWISSSNQILTIQAVCAFLLLAGIFWSYSHWKRTGNRGLPLFSALAAMYWVYFAVQLFWGDRVALDWRHAHREVGNEAVTGTMLLVTLGVACLWLGIESKLGRRFAPRRLPQFAAGSGTVIYVQGVAAIGILLSARSLFGESDTRQIFEILKGTVTMSALLMLFQRVLDGKARGLEKPILVALILFRAVVGVSSGWMGAAATLFLCCALVYLYRRRRFPVAVVLIVLPYVLFFQAGKEEFRREYWLRQAEGSIVDKVEYWTSASWTRWQNALSDPSGHDLVAVLSMTLTRTSLLNQAASVMEQTPSIVPYQYGRLYSYLAYSLIPRFVWPDKPSVNDANQFYQVAYGVTRERDLGATSIAVGMLTEGYINFSWFGTAAVMFLFGILLDFWNEAFLVRGGPLVAAIGIALVPNLIAVETQMAQTVSGIVQCVGLTMIVFLPVARWGKARGKAV